MPRSVANFNEADLKALADAALYGYVEQHEAKRALGDHPSLTAETTWTETLDESIRAVRQNLRRNQLAYGPEDARLLLDHLGVSYAQDEETFRRLARLLEMATLKSYEVEQRRHAGDYGDTVAYPNLAGCRQMTTDDIAKLFADPSTPTGSVSSNANGHAGASEKIAGQAADQLISDQGAHPEWQSTPNQGAATPPNPSPDDAEDGSEPDTARFREVADLYKAERRHGNIWTNKSSNQFDQTVDLFVNLMGDRPISKIAKADITEFKKRLTRLPSKYAQSSKYMRGSHRMTPSEAIEEAARNGETTFMVAKTVNRHLSFLRGFFEWTLENDYGLHHNPASKASIKVKKKKKRNAFSGTNATRRPFSNDELRTIFFSPLYTGCARANVRHQPGNKVIKDARYFAPLIALYSGMRREEICQLRPADIEYYDGRPFFITQENDGQQLKNENAWRAVPVHPMLEAAGLLDHWQTMKTHGQRFLFPDLTFVDADGNPVPVPAEKSMGDTIGKWFGHFLNHLGLKDPTVVFHSFRHNVSTALLNCRDVDPATAKTILGHEVEGETHTTYFGGYEPATLFRTLQNLNYDFDEELREVFNKTTHLNVEEQPKPAKSRRPHETAA